MYPDPRDTAPAPAPRHRRRLLLAVVVVLILAVSIAAGIHRRNLAEAALEQDTGAEAVPAVQVIQPKPDRQEQALVLPGQTMAFTDAPIFARTSGYLKRWFTDIGARVKRGDLLAQIETPELDQQLRQARADLQTAQASTRLAGITAQRTAQLLQSQSVSTQERDNAAGAFAADQATVASRQAAVARLEELQSYENVYAPFDGVITARNTDIGDLINAGAGSPTTELFHLASTDKLRIYVPVPELDAPFMAVGATPVVTLDEFPGQSFKARLVRTNNAIDPASRTLLVEVDLDNADGRVLPGAYAFVHFNLPGRTHSFVVPSNALLFRSEGLRVGVVRNGMAQLVPITIGRDYGDSVEVLSGLHGDDQVILNPSDSLISGTPVRVVAPKPAGPG